MAAPIRVLTAVPICDGHDSAINTINLEFIRHGIEVVYLGYHRYATDMVRAAIQEDVKALGISSYNGGHVEFFSEVARLLKKQGADYIKVFGGGGGTITGNDDAIMRRNGIDKIFFAGTSLGDMVEYVHKHYGGAHKAISRAQGECRDAIGAEVDGDRGRVRQGEEETPNVQRPTSNVQRKRRTQEQRKHARLRFHGTGRSGEDDVD